MDRYSRAYWEMGFENRFLRHKAMAFQDFFGDIMEKRCPGGDFIRVRPWGNQGDRKNDGYLRSRRMLFQVYAPNEFTERETIKKIDDDFDGALPYWKEYFNTWVFVHNSREGLSPGVTARLLELGQKQKDIEVTWWGFEELRRELFSLCEEDISALLGPAPSPRDFAEIGFEKIKPVLDVISRAPVPAELELSAVPRDKVQINRLSQNTELLIQLGRRRSHIVRKFLIGYPDPQFGDEVVQAFRARYDALRASGVGPDHIFQELQVFAGGERTSDTGHQAAVLTVLAYLFDQCDIFESVPEVKDP
jgi:hypothetical protein